MLLLPLLLFSSLLSVSWSDPAQTFLRQPEDQTTTQGMHVTLPCRVSNKRGTLQWTRDGFGLGIERNLTGFDRYQMTGSDEEGDFTLDINPVLLEDDAVFQCQVGAAEGVLPIRSRDATLTVNVPPEAPIIINGAVVRTIEDRDIEVECVSRAGKPAAEITWLDATGTVITDGITKKTEDIEGTKRKTAISRLKLAAKKAHHNATLTCRAANQADREARESKILLLVEYAPHVKVTPDHTPIFEGENVVFKCAAHANPGHMTYRWFVNNEIVPETHGTELRMAAIGRELHNKIVKCEVNNAIGKSEETETLDIQYAPRFVRKPQDVSGEKGQEIVLRCNVDGNPAPTYTWFRNGDFRTVRGYESNLTVSISPATVGTYICRASVRGFTEIQASAQVLMKGPPRILSRIPVQYGYEGDSVRLVCDGFSIPKPDSISWTLHGYPVSAAGAHYSFEEEFRDDGLVSTLVIASAIETDFGEYNCTVRNSHGEDSFVFKLERKQSLPLIIVLAAVVGGLILTVFLIFVMVMCRRANLLQVGLFATSNGSKKSTVTSSASTNGNGVASSGSSSKRTATSATTATSSSRRGKACSTMTGEDLGALSDEWDEDEAAEEDTKIKISGIRPRIVNGMGDYHNFAMADPGYYPSEYYVPMPPYLPSSSAQPPPPPHPNRMNMLDPSDPSSADPASFHVHGLNVADPRFSAKYGNAFLRSPVHTAGGGAYATLAGQGRTKAGGYVPVPTVGGLSGGGAMGVSGGGHLNGTLPRGGVNGSHHRYIVAAQESDALATHV